MGCTPGASTNDAAVWRRPWTDSTGSPKAYVLRLKAFEIQSGWSDRPSSHVNTSGETW